MSNADFLHQDKHTLAGHALFMLFSMSILLLMFSSARMGFYFYNVELAEGIAGQVIVNSFLTGVRFDLIVVCLACAPLLTGFLWPTSIALRRFFVLWLTLITSVSILLCIAELDFYREFHQRLNSLVFEYVRQDPATVLSMLWNGFPVLRYLLLWLLFSWLMFRFYLLVDHAACLLILQRAVPYSPAARHVRGVVFLLVFLSMAVGARGTLRQGPPLRWGDAFHSTHLFANHLGLNGVFTLYKAATDNNSSKAHRKTWLEAMPIEEATKITAGMLLTQQDQLLGGDAHPLLRHHTSTKQAGNVAARPNVVVILMESFSGAFTGALGNDHGITPEFDRIAQHGLLFNRFFSNGTHTHQGMFATLTSFPNLPGYEYLMNQPEGGHKFSGLPLLLNRAGYQQVYIYNGSFSWDNQEGYFRNQGMTRFIGRDQFVNPVFSDPTWGVSDQDMFDRAATELSAMSQDKPFFAMLQTLSNHTPYAIPNPLPVPPVTDQGIYNEHLTAMRYADWALGQFFRKIENEPWYSNTYFVLLGDHGFGIDNQVTDIDLLRFRVPLLIIGPQVQQQYGTHIDRVATQVDIAPTVMGLLGESSDNQCWGRDVLSLQDHDAGFGVIKPSGNDEIVGLIKGDRIVVKRPGAPVQLFQYDLTPAQASVDHDEKLRATMEKQLHAYVERAMRSLLDNTASAGQP